MAEHDASTAEGTSEPDRAPLAIETEITDTKATLRLAGWLDLATTQQLQSAVEQVPTTCRHVELDLQELSFIDSTGVGALVRCRRALDAEFRTLSLTNPSERATFVLGLTGLGDLLEQPSGAP